MCGRYSLTIDFQTLADEFALSFSEPPRGWRPRYHIAPSQPVPILVSQAKPNLDIAVWGLIPSWSKDPSIGQRMINARQETLTVKPSFKGLLRSQRCLVLADGFYEWQRKSLRKTPYYIRLKSGRPFAFAGLWSHWVGPDGSEIRSCTIITGKPNSLLQPIHDRMPVILPRGSREQWMDPACSQARDLEPLLKPYNADQMEAYPVSPMVNSSGYDESACVKPFDGQ
ncbi:MAG: hypothetical protein COV74_06235 [Candidatus Omnitrophica bacterium CG11_big_fil_rev_8_21_14_0_20_45_26]|uniref:Abasic site processing protein n=1 Tax=Candidatus Abzuiibacterium crystallinum TaxID=1974748 RepID=A0A2H0LNS2_9BACT|nr:MAG: hypothetical protein COV74_06235 [Candidatus Omnitrophica bacterium CG11_big_fil_rev_8_21_14_0_20_45_26]PIW65642.1 MAG: hypothetical protein COW12_00615 [Candidatus Omnitrophica bacterium CG12_big_fil_rev_8_21_14_0_65_45_16]